MKLDDFLSRLENVRRVGRQFEGCCPAHDDQTPSLSIRLKDGRILVKCFAGCSAEAIVGAMGLTMRDLFDDDASSYERARAKFAASSGSGTGGTRGSGRARGKDWGTVVATYLYEDEDGVARHYVERTSTKQFPQGRIVDGKKVLGLNGEKVGLYRLPELLAAPLDQAVYVAEGEKDVLALVDRGLLATCNPGGALKFRAAHAEPLRGRPVVIVMDRDEPGRKHAVLVARLLDGVAASVRVVQAKTGKDAHDHFAAGQSVGDFQEIDMSELKDETKQAASSTDKPEKEDAVAALEQLLTQARAELWHDDDDRAYLTVTVDGKLRHGEIGTSICDELLSRVYFNNKRKALSEHSLGTANRHFRAKARYEGPRLQRARRISLSNSVVYLALFDDGQRVAKVTASGWDLVAEEDCPMRFVREPSVEPLPVPVGGGDLGAMLARFVNAKAEHIPLVVAFLVGVFLPKGTYPILLVTGPQRSGKTSGCKVIRGLVDPQRGDLNKMPKSDGDLMAQLSACDVLGYDNVEKISADLSDSLCSVVCGTGFSARKLYTNNELITVVARKPIIINGIGDVARRADLLDRCLVAEFQHFADGEGSGEVELDTELEQLRPRMLGAILDRTVRAMRDHTQMIAPPIRLVDFGRWALAACVDDHERERLLAVLTSNRDELNASTIDNDNFAQALIAWIEQEGEVTLRASEILSTLNERRTETPQRFDGWPKEPAGVAKALARLLPVLRRSGIEVEQVKRTGSARRWHLRRGSRPSQPSQPSTMGPVELAGPESKQDGTRDGLEDQEREASPPDTLFEPGDDGCDRCDGLERDFEEIVI